MAETLHDKKLYEEWSKAICEALMETIPPPQSQKHDLYLSLLNLSYALASMLPQTQPELYEYLKKDFLSLYNNSLQAPSTSVPTP